MHTHVCSVGTGAARAGGTDVGGARHTEDPRKNAWLFTGILVEVGLWSGGVVGKLQGFSLVF